MTVVGEARGPRCGGRCPRRGRRGRRDVVVVHGAGPQITAEMERRGIEPEFVGGRRVTTPDVLDVVAESLLAVNAEVCAAIGARADRPARGRDRPRAPGRRRSSGSSATPSLLPPPRSSRRSPPAVCRSSPRSPTGPLNVNADEAAAALAVGLGAERIVFVSDVPGVLVDGSVADVLSADDAVAGARGGPVRGRDRAEADGGGPRRPRRRPGLDRRHGGAGLSPASNRLLQGLRAAVLPTYARADLTIVRGEGCRVWDDVGRSYLDFVAGIAVVGLGHRHPGVTAAAHAQLDELWHASNLYWTEPMLRLAGAPLASVSAARRRSSATRAPRRTRPRSRSRGRRPDARGSSRSRAASTAGRSARCRRRASPRSGKGSGRSSRESRSRDRTTSSRSRQRSRPAASWRRS